MEDGVVYGGAVTAASCLHGEAHKFVPCSAMWRGTEKGVPAIFCQGCGEMRSLVVDVDYVTSPIEVPRGMARA